VRAALGMGRDSLSADFVVEQNGKQIKVTLTGTGSAAGDAHMAAGQQVDMRRTAPGEDPLWMRLPALNWWFRITPEHVLYIRHRSISPFADGETNEQFFHRAFAAGDSAHIERVVLDIRGNGGGNNFMNRYVVKEIIRRPAIDKPDKLLVLIDRGVFSAAQNLVNELSYFTSATFVGEPTGNAPNQFGDARPLELPRSHFVVHVSSLLWQSHQAADNRAWFTPDVYAEMSAQDYRTKRDPVLEAALRHAAGPSLATTLATAIENAAAARKRDTTAKSDTAEVRSAINSYRYNDENKYRNVEADVNRAGYELLNSGKTDAAVAVLTVNASQNPRSGNAYDSLGEALEKAGKKDAAIAAYKKALELDPRMFTSGAGLKRLGASP
ncbi:MAG TPA: tetratricopeptide repeat protein, partial [Gemmatimonadaceae bacterium]